MFRDVRKTKTEAYNTGYSQAVTHPSTNRNTIQYNRIARVTFEEGGEAAKADFQDEGSIRIFGVECEVISPAPPVEKVLVYNFP